MEDSYCCPYLVVSGDRLKCSNHRPVSLTYMLCKLFERLVKRSLVSYISNNDLLRDSQHGFLPGRSCSTALLSFLDEITSSVDDRNFP